MSAAPLWSSGFRPFFLLGSAYAPLALAPWVIAWGGTKSIGGQMPMQLWHAHEMLFGLVAAFLCGFVLTALPSWAGTPSITGRPLMTLALAWCAGRGAMWSAPWLPHQFVAALDLALLPMLAITVLPSLLRVQHRRYLALVAVLAALTAANVMFHVACQGGDWAGAERFLLIALGMLAVMFALVAGFLIPIFTETALDEIGQSRTIGFVPHLEAAAIASVLAFAVTSWPGTPPPVAGLVALAAAAVHLLRMLRWHTFTLSARPLELAMHAAYGWLIAAMILRAASQYTTVVPPHAWVHAFGGGAVGLMILAILNRVVRRHTGRPLAPSRTVMVGLAIMGAAGAMRVLASLWWDSALLLLLSGLAWAAPFALFLLTDGPTLWRPSLPRQGTPRIGGHLP